MQRVLRDFLKTDLAGGIILIGATLAAMLIANSPAANFYFDVLAANVGGLSVLHWVNDALMALFFLLVGLEIKREFIKGELASWSARTLPFIAAAAGMAVPALLYIGFTGGDLDLARGWAIPTATDIAFANGVLALLGRRSPPSLKLFLVTVAIVDDMGAVAIIALAYTPAISGPALLAAALIFGAMVALDRLGVRRLWPYLLLAGALWLAVLSSGVHATIAGVLAAFAIPIGEGRNSPLDRLEHHLAPWVILGIVPLFALANAGVSLAGVGFDHLVQPLTLGVALGLFLGKQIGIFGGIRLAVACGLAKPPVSATWLQVYGVALLCGIGFTMSLFIGGLAFDNPLFSDEVKIGVLGGSLMSAVSGYAVLWWANRRPAAI